MTTSRKILTLQNGHEFGVKVLYTWAETIKEATTIFTKNKSHYIAKVNVDKFKQQSNDFKELTGNLSQKPP